MNSGITADIIGVQWIVGGQVNFDHTRFAPDFVDFGVLRVNKSTVASVDTIQCTIELDSGEFLTSEEYHLAGDDNCLNPTPVITLTTVTNRRVTFLSSTSSSNSFRLSVTGVGNTDIIESTATVLGTNYHV